MSATTLDLIAIQSDSTGYAGTFRALIGATGALGYTAANVADPLSQFAQTTSAQLRSVLSDETGTGAAVFGTSPTLTTPTINAASISGNVDVANGGKLRFLDSGLANRGEIYYDATFGGLRFGAAFGNGVEFAAIQCDGTLRVAETGGSIRFSDIASDGLARFSISLSSSSLVFNNPLGNDYVFQQLGVDKLRIAYSTGKATFGHLVALSVFTVSTLPSASANASSVAVVTDSNAAASGNYGATVAGGGSNRVKVFSNGTNWVIA